MEAALPTNSKTEIPFIRLPSSQNLFSYRAVRLRQLAQSHSSLAAYLRLMANLAGVQQTVSESTFLARLPDSYNGQPPLEVSSWRLESIWRENLRAIAERLDPDVEPLSAIRKRIQQAADEEMETWADRLLAADFDHMDLGIAPFVAAALQVHWTAAAARLDAERIGPARTGYLCPVCGSLPVASVLQAGGPAQGLRYLCCGLCASEWNRPRIHCMHCGSAKDVAYFGLEGTGDVVKAEACAACKTYVKIMNREKDPQVDPFADDLATLSLDILMAEEGYQRLGFNPLLIPGG